MRIALLHNRLILRGGLETRLLNYLTRFDELGHEVTVICAKKDPKILLPERVKVIVLPLGLMPKPFRPWYFSKKTLPVLKAQSFDFVLSLSRTHQQDAVLMPGGHLGFLEALGKWKTSISDYMQIHLDRIAFANSPIILAASSMMKEEMVNKYGVSPEKIHLIFPPLNIEKYNPDLRPHRLRLRDEFKLVEGKKYFLFISTSHYRKGLDILLKTFAVLDPEKYELLIIGQPTVKSRLKNVTYLGFISDLKAWYTAADFMILPARYEPFGQVVSEALQCGTPVLVSSNVGAKDLIGPQEGEVIDSFDPEKWAEVIQKTAVRQFEVPSDFGLRNQLDLASHVDRILEIYQKHSPGRA